MKSLKNKKCSFCGKPAQIWLPDSEGETTIPACLKCAEIEADACLGSVDDEGDDFLSFTSEDGYDL